MGMLDVELKNLRAYDLYAVYKKGLREGRFRSIRDAAEYARLQPAPRFYISAKVAGSFIRQIQSGVSLIWMNPLARQRAWEIYDRYLLKVESGAAVGVSRETVLEELLEQEAPQFYISAETARKILQEENRRIRSGIGRDNRLYR